VVAALVQEPATRRTSIRCGARSSSCTPSGPSRISRLANLFDGRPPVLVAEPARPGSVVVLGQEVHGQVRRAQRHSVGVVGLRHKPHAVSRLRVLMAELGVEPDQASPPVSARDRGGHPRPWVRPRTPSASRRSPSAIASHSRSAGTGLSPSRKHLPEPEVGQRRPGWKTATGAGRRPIIGRDGQAQLVDQSCDAELAQPARAALAEHAGQATLPASWVMS